MSVRWEAVSVRKDELDAYLREGWEPLGASMVPGQSFTGQPVVHEYWHLRRAVSASVEVGNRAATLRGRPSRI